ncbi:hypothetical protein scyTo_0020715 [Scyliorhinus torazame]|uniref:Uncharacterized protein n=1 Tax=Scyliorhinus torazame TaxID=75743 RepID=A0A401Q0K6_SCYTO|nr:hypothetical protein [Scyliorhinus torazame]
MESQKLSKRQLEHLRLEMIKKDEDLSRRWDEIGEEADDVMGLENSLNTGENMVLKAPELNMVTRLQATWFYLKQPEKIYQISLCYGACCGNIQSPPEETRDQVSKLLF